MKYRCFFLLAITGAGSGCQHKASLPAAVAAQAVSTVGLPLPRLPPISEFAPGDTLTVPMRGWLRRHDVAKYWHHRDGYLRLNDGVMDGFLGPEHYRFAMMFNEVERDKEHEEVYHIRGKCRYRHFIRPFTGVLVMQQLVNMPFSRNSLKGNHCLTDTSLVGPYTLRARLHLEEQPTGDEGVFDAEALVDFYLPDLRGHAPGYAGHDDAWAGVPTRGGGILVRGRRRNQATGEEKEFVVSPLVLAAAPDVFEDFVIGERHDEMNPKYAHLGWNELWENKEWWHDAALPFPYF